MNTNRTSIPGVSIALPSNRIGVYVDRLDGSVRFRWVSSPTTQELTQLTQTIARRVGRVGRYLERQSLLERDAENSGSSRGHTLFSRYISTLWRIHYFSIQTTVEAAELVRKWRFSPGFQIQIKGIKVSVPG